MKLRTYSNYAILEQPAKIHFEHTGDPLKTDAENFNESTFQMSLQVNPLLLEMIEEFGFTRRGSRNFIFTRPADGEGRKARRDFTLRYSSMFAPMSLNNLEPFYTSSWPQEAFAVAFLNRPEMRNTDLRFTKIPGSKNSYYDNRYLDYSEIIDWNAVEGGELYKANIKELLGKRNPLPTPAAIVTIGIKNDTIWLRIVEKLNPLLHKFVSTEGFVSSFATSRRSADPFSMFEINQVEELLSDSYIVKQFFTDESDETFDLVDLIEKKVLVGYKPGEPAKAFIRVGSEVPGRKASSFKRQTNAPSITLSEAEDLKTKIDADFLFHPALEDVSSMLNATPAEHDERLRDYQAEAVGLHLSTNIGYLNSCSPGLGKTVMQLSAMRERAKSNPNYRGLILAEMNVLKQWQEHFEEWFPEAKHIITDNNKNVEDVLETLSVNGPAVVLMPYTHLNNVAREMSRFETLQNITDPAERVAYISNMAETNMNLGSVLLNMRWHDIAADEAIVIRTNNSKQSKAAWKLRSNSEVAVALTGTPINTKVEDIANLLSWVRGDKHLFRGVKFEDYNLADQESALTLFNTFGPLVFRRDNSEIAEELPEVGEPKVLMLTPNSGELALIETAENELRRCYEELLQALDLVKTNQDNEAEIARMKEELKDARSAWLGGQTLARMATSDPSTIAKSESVGATLLTGQGLVDGALRETPTKRKALVNEVAKRVSSGEQVLVFVEFEQTAHALKETFDKNGIKAESFTGKNRKVRDNHRVAFQNGEIDVLVITKAGERGLTLHKAAAVYCYDLPWSIESVIQRIGRAVRIGSTNETVDVIFMVMAGTIEERIAEKLITTAVSASSLLDATRGVDVKKTETMNAFGGLVKTLGSRMTNKAIHEFGTQFLDMTPETETPEKEEELV